MPIQTGLDRVAERESRPQARLRCDWLIIQPQPDQCNKSLSSHWTHTQLTLNSPLNSHSKNLSTPLNSNSTPTINSNSTPTQLQLTQLNSNSTPPTPLNSNSTPTQLQLNSNATPTQLQSTPLNPTQLQLNSRRALWDQGARESSQRTPNAVGKKPALARARTRGCSVTDFSCSMDVRLPIQTGLTDRHRREPQCTNRAILITPLGSNYTTVP